MFQGTAATIVDHHLPILLRVEPSAKELTLEEYENCMGIKPDGGEGQEAEDVNGTVGENPKAQVSASVPVARTRQEAIKALRGKGYEWNDLKSKTKAELNALL